MTNERLYFTLFKADGEVTQLPRKPTPKMIHEILDCERIENVTLGIKYNGKDHHEVSVLIDDLGVSKKKPVNLTINRALADSSYWKNVGMKGEGMLVVLGDAIVVSLDSLLNPRIVTVVPPPVNRFCEFSDSD